MPDPQTQTDFAVYLLSAEDDDDWVENRIALSLRDVAHLPPYFFKWQAIPGRSRQQSMADGFRKSKCCAVFLGTRPLGGLQKTMQELMTEHRAACPDYFLIPVFLPGSDPSVMPDFLQGLVPVDFRVETNFDWQFHRLVCGIRKEQPGPWLPEMTSVAEVEKIEQERISLQFQLMIGAINDAEKKGMLSQENADRFKEKAADQMMKLVSQNTSVAQVNAQESRVQRD